MNESLLSKTEKPNEWIEISRLRNRRGHIGNQGFLEDHVIELLRYIDKDFAPGETSLRKMLEVVNKTPELHEKVKKFIEDNPIYITFLPEDLVGLNNGHHRAFIADQIGMKSIPYVVKESNINLKENRSDQKR